MPETVLVFIHFLKINRRESRSRAALAFLTVMPKINGHEVWVEIDGTKLDEFAIQVEEDVAEADSDDDEVPQVIISVTCYIPSQAGKVGASAHASPKGGL